MQIFSKTLTALVHEAMFHAATPADELKRHVDCVEDQHAARDQLFGLGLVAFVANGSVLPRASGASDQPMAASVAVPFVSPPSMLVSVPVPNAGRFEGMGIKRGISIIVGGGFHGKSTRVSWHRIPDLRQLGSNRMAHTLPPLLPPCGFLMRQAARGPPSGDLRQDSGGRTRESRRRHRRCQGAESGPDLPFTPPRPTHPARLTAPTPPRPPHRTNPTAPDPPHPPLGAC